MYIFEFCFCDSITDFIINNTTNSKVTKLKFNKERNVSNTIQALELLQSVKGSGVTVNNYSPEKITPQ